MFSYSFVLRNGKAGFGWQGTLWFCPASKLGRTVLLMPDNPCTLNSNEVIIGTNTLNYI